MSCRPERLSMGSERSGWERHSGIGGGQGLSVKAEESVWFAPGDCWKLKFPF